MHFASDADDANAYVRNIAAQNDVKTVIKSKSMVSEEMGLNHVLEADNIEVVETDLGEYIIQLAGEAPYHIIAPAIHKTKEQVADLLAEESNTQRRDTAEELTRQAREMLREVFQRADMSITGANFAVAETGSIVLVTNEGNGRMATSMPRIHVAAMGMEKLIPSVADLSAMLRILIRSATGQRISCYVTMVNGPRAQDEEDGPEEFHLVIMNNGRDRLLRDDSLREAPQLYPLRCLHELMPRIPQSRRTLLWLGISRANRIYCLASPDWPQRWLETPSSIIALRSLPRSMSRQDKHPSHVARAKGADGARSTRSCTTRIGYRRANDMEGMAAGNDEPRSLRSWFYNREIGNSTIKAGWMADEGAATDFWLDGQSRFPRASTKIIRKTLR